MPNNFAECKNIARLILPRLTENLVFPNLISKDFSETFVPGKGAKIQVRKPVVLTAEEFNESTGVHDQDINEPTVEVALDHLATVDVNITSVQMATNIEDLNRQVIEPAAVALAEKINRDGLALYKDIPYVTGTAGTTPSTIAAFTAARKKLNDLKAPVAGRNAVWDSAADAKFLEIDAVLHASKSGDTEALRNGSIGRLIGFDNYMSQAVKTHTKGTLAAGGTSAKITVKSSVDHADSVVLDVTASASGTLTGTLVKGDLLTIGGNVYVVTEDATASGNEITAKVYPNITVAADVEATVMGSHVANLAFCPAAFSFVTRPLSAPKGVEAYVTSYNGVTLRVVRGYDMTYKKEKLSVDVLYGYKTMYPELAVRCMG